MATFAAEVRAYVEADTEEEARQYFWAMADRNGWGYDGNVEPDDEQMEEVPRA